MKRNVKGLDTRKLMVYSELISKIVADLDSIGMQATYAARDGQITDQMIRRPVLELTTFGILGSVDAVSKKFDAPHGICGKCDPGQGIGCWMGGGQVRMRNIKLGGK